MLARTLSTWFRNCDNVTIDDTINHRKYYQYGKNLLGFSHGDGAKMMDMPLPDNTLPMMAGKDQFGAIEMGGMFTTVKVREGLARNDYKDPGFYKHPKGTVAHEVANDLPPIRRAIPSNTVNEVEVTVRKPNGHAGH